MEQVYRRFGKTNKIDISFGRDYKLAKRYRITLQDRGIMLTPNPELTQGDTIRTITDRGQITIPKSMRFLLNFNDIARVVKEDDGTIYIYPFNNGNCDLCNSNRNLMIHRGIRICDECLRRINELISEVRQCG